jgi:hypothetical protein
MKVICYRTKIRMNVYKLYRATRTGPESIIDPKKQLALYVPGIRTRRGKH